MSNSPKTVLLKLRNIDKTTQQPYRKEFHATQSISIPEYEAFAYPYYPDHWFITHTRTGIALGSGRTLDEARNKARTRWGRPETVAMLENLPSVESLPLLEDLTTQTQSGIV